MIAAVALALGIVKPTPELIKAMEKHMEATKKLIECLNKNQCSNTKKQ